MKKKHSVIVVLAFLIGIGITGQAMAYSINNMFVQSRHLEDGRVLNRFYVDFKDDNGVLVTEDVMVSMSLKDPNGTEILNESGVKFALETDLDGAYDGPTGRWYFGQFINNQWEAHTYQVGYYYGDAAAPFTDGIYSLSATMNDGNTLVKSDYVFKDVSLPIIKSSSMKPKWNKTSDGAYLTCTWAIPTDIYRTNIDLPGGANSNLQTSVRYSVTLYYKDANKIDQPGLYLTVKVPTHMGFVYIPQTIGDLIPFEVSKAEARIQLRTNDNNNRTYSNYKKLPPAPKTRK